jgi:SAM-dependent methyltransferase
MITNNPVELESQQTIEYYNREFNNYVSSTFTVDMTGLYREFLPLVKPKGYILDAGCGPGRDSLYFIRQGFRIMALDASEAMVAYATKLIGQSVLKLKFTEMDFESVFDGVWACASLLHIPKTQIDDVFSRIVRSLVNGGIFYSSFKYGDVEAFRNGRLFSNYTVANFRDLVARHSELSIVKIWKTPDVRPGRTGEFWLNSVCRKEIN